MPKSTPTKRHKNHKNKNIKTSFRFTKPKIIAAVLAFAVIGVATVLFSSAATTIPTGSYQGGINPRGQNDFAKKYLQRPTSDVVLEFVPGDSWAAIEGPSWMTDPWKNSEYKRKMVFGVPMLPPDTSTSLAQGATGAYNTHYQKLAQNLVNAGMDNAVLRIGWEFNGNWFRWSAANGQANNFINYWKQIVTTMRSVPGANFKYDWNPTNGTASLAYPEQAYPGDTYVDYIGIDAYNGSWISNYQDPVARWNDIMYAPRGLDYWVTFAESHNKPISFPEWGTGDREDGHGGGDDSAFIKNMYDVMSSTNTAYNVYWDYPALDYNAALKNNPKAAAEFTRLFGGVTTPTTPVPVKPTITLQANPANIAGGGSGTLTWNSANATSCAASGGWNGNRAVTGTLSLSPNTTTAYTLTCTGSGGSASASATITVTPPVSTPAPTIKITASPVSITKGASSTIAWSSTNTTSCSTSGAWGNTSIAISGNKIVTPTLTSSYTLTCKGAGGQSSANTTIVVAPPVISPPQPPTTSAPEFVITPTPKGSNQQITGKVQLSLPPANRKGVTKVEYSVDSKVRYATTNPSKIYTLDTRDLKNGTHLISVKVTTASGSNATTKQVTIYNKSSFWSRVRSWF